MRSLTGSQEKEKHAVSHIAFQPWCTAYVKGRTQDEPHRRIERVMEASCRFVSVIFFVMKDVAASDGLTVLSMYVKSFGCVVSTVVEKKERTVRSLRVERDNVKQLWSLGHHSTLPSGASLIPRVETVKSKRQVRSAFSSPRRSHQSNEAIENFHKQLQ